MVRSKFDIEAEPKDRGVKRGDVKSPLDAGALHQVQGGAGITSPHLAEHEKEIKSL